MPMPPAMNRHLGDPASGKLLRGPRDLGAVGGPQGVWDTPGLSVRWWVCVGAEEGALPLDEGGGEAFAAEAVVVGQGGGEAGIGSPDGTS